MKRTLSKYRQELKTLAEKGIQSEAHQLKKDMCSQFANPNEWIREYVVNAYDAGASRCTVFGNENKEVINIFVWDNGHGMDKNAVMSALTLYRSLKKGNPKEMIGCHGIGILSVAAVPGQVGFQMLTSTGKEAWRVSAGFLLDENPITIEKIEPVPDKGTQFCIQFKTKQSLFVFMHRLQKVLKQYVQYLPLDIQLCMPGTFKVKKASKWMKIHNNWQPVMEDFGKEYSIEINDHHFDIVMCLDSGAHELYQKRVLITNKYNLFSCDMEETWLVPYIHVRVDCADFELPFGRHCLRNEPILYPLAQTIRNRLLPDFYEKLALHYSQETQSFINEVELITVALCKYRNKVPTPWTHLPIFRLVDQTRISLDDLRREVEKRQKLYWLEDDEPGIDYSLFDAPVLFSEQVDGGLELIQELFPDNLINLSIADLVIEAPAGSHPELSDVEKRFETSLGFHPDALKEANWKKENKNTLPLSQQDMERLKSCHNDLKQASNEMENIAWKVNYLVERDGKTPCTTHKFLFNANTIVLNLHHPDIRRLVQLSKKDYALAGHWAMAMCLTENSSILPHLTAEVKEDLLLVDAMAKMEIREQPLEYTGRRDTDRKKESTIYWEFFRNASN